MSNIVILGTQWGDEGKGKVVDLLTPSFDTVARYQGGHNAGHTVYLEGQKIVLHLIPSGILHPGKLCLVGNGIALSPQALLEEIAALKAFGASVGNNLVISRNAHLILPYHMAIEKMTEEKRGERKIGTTSRGIGPAYEDKAARSGIRAGDLLDLEVLEEKIRTNVEFKNAILRTFGFPPLDANRIYEEYAGYASRIGNFIGDVSLILDQKIRQGKPVLFEGAQGSLLDIDHGTYPYVTSSNSTAGGVCTGLGIGPTRIDAVIGVTKAYTTRVGGGPFPTEIADKRGELILERGNEFGATTGRPRRCGWFDALAVSYSCRLNGAERIILTKPDILDIFEEIFVCVGYRYKGELLKSFPPDPWILEKVTPEYKKIKGWAKPINQVRDFDALPGTFLDYVRIIEDEIEAKVCLISTGFARKDSILIDSELRELVDLQKIRAEL